MKILLAILVLGCVVGCNSSADDEAEAARQLAPKPLSESEKGQIEKIRSDFPDPGGTKPGR